MGPVDAVAASNVGEVTIELAPAEDALLSPANSWATCGGESTEAIPEAVDVNFSMSMMNPGDDVDVQLAGPDIDRLRAAADEVKARLAEYAGVYEISDSFRAGKEEMQLGIKPARRDARADPAGSGSAGPAGVLRRGGPAHPARGATISG